MSNTTKLGWIGQNGNERGKLWKRGWHPQKIGVITNEDAWPNMAPLNEKKMIMMSMMVMMMIVMMKMTRMVALVAYKSCSAEEAATTVGRDQIPV